jgi:hypothetical protein
MTEQPPQHQSPPAPSPAYDEDPAVTAAFEELARSQEKLNDAHRFQFKLWHAVDLFAGPHPQAEGNAAAVMAFPVDERVEPGRPFVVPRITYRMPCACVVQGPRQVDGGESCGRGGRCVADVAFGRELVVHLGCSERRGQLRQAQVAALGEQVQCDGDSQSSIIGTPSLRCRRAIPGPGQSSACWVFLCGDGSVEVRTRSALERHWIGLGGGTGSSERIAQLPDRNGRRQLLVSRVDGARRT